MQDPIALLCRIQGPWAVRAHTLSPGSFGGPFGGRRPTNLGRTRSGPYIGPWAFWDLILGPYAGSSCLPMQDPIALLCRIQEPWAVRAYTLDPESFGAHLEGEGRLIWGGHDRAHTLGPGPFGPHIRAHTFWSRSWIDFCFISYVMGGRVGVDEAP